MIERIENVGMKGNTEITCRVCDKTEEWKIQDSYYEKKLKTRKIKFMGP